MTPDEVAQAGWEELIASVRQRMNQLQEAQQRSCDHLARVSETLAQSCRDEFRLLHQSWQGMFDEAITSVRNDPRHIVALAAAREKFGPGTFFGDYFCFVGKSATATERDAALKR